MYAQDTLVRTGDGGYLVRKTTKRDISTRKGNVPRQPNALWASRGQYICQVYDLVRYGTTNPHHVKSPQDGQHRSLERKRRDAYTTHSTARYLKHIVREQPIPEC